MATVELDPELKELIAEKAADKIAAQVIIDPTKLFDPRVGVKEACKYLACGRTYFDQHYMTAPDFPIHYKGSDYQFRLSEIKRWEETHPGY